MRRIFFKKRSIQPFILVQLYQFQCYGAKCHAIMSTYLKKKNYNLCAADVTMLRLQVFSARNYQHLSEFHIYSRQVFGEVVCWGQRLQIFGSESNFGLIGKYRKFGLLCAKSNALFILGLTNQTLLNSGQNWQTIEIGKILTGLQLEQIFLLDTQSFLWFRKFSNRVARNLGSIIWGIREFYPGVEPWTLSLSNYWAQGKQIVL